MSEKGGNFSHPFFFVIKNQLKKQDKRGLSVILSTRQVDEEYIKHMQKTSGLGDRLEILTATNQGDKGLAQVYNELSTVAANAYQLFVHDDLIFETQDWGLKLINHLNKGTYDIIGMAGVRNELPASGCWWTNTRNMVGIVNHIQYGQKYASVYSKEQGNKIEPVIIVDGLFIAVNTEVVSQKWDESIPGFHFYDLGFCFPCYLDGYNIGVVTDIRITHKSIGVTNQQWDENRMLFADKYKDELPCLQ